MTDKTAANVRQERLSALASASGAELLELWGRLGIDPACEMVRGPETGLVALRGRIGGGGDPFNFGEATVTRATEDGLEVATVAEATRQAKLIAILDALAQDPEMETKIDSEIVRPLQASLAARDAERRAETAATKVDFFTMVRGED